MFDAALGGLSGLDVLVNNAGIAGPTAKREEIAPDDWERTLAVNVTGQFKCAQLAIPHLRRSRNPSIVNLSSAAGRFGFPLRTPYSASKWAVIGFTARRRWHSGERDLPRIGRWPDGESNRCTRTRRPRAASIPPWCSRKRSPRHRCAGS